MGKYAQIMGKSWENHGKIIGQRWEKHATILGKSLGKDGEKYHEKNMGTSPIDVDSWEKNLCLTI